MTVHIDLHQEVQRKLLSGVNQLADTARITLGPGGRNVMIQSKIGAPLVTNDGEEIIRSIDLPDFVENMGARIIREAALKTNELAGDGTTTSIVLAQRIAQLGFKNIAAGANPMEMRKGIQLATQLAVAAIRKMSVPVRTHGEIARAAACSSQDPELGELIAGAVDQVGCDGVSIKESENMETRLKIQKGMQFDRGYLLPQMADDRRGMVTEMDHPYVLVTDLTLSDSSDLIPLLEQLSPLGHPLLIVAEGIGGEVLGLLMENRRQGVLNTVAVHPPAYGEGRLARLEDLALLTGGVFFSQSTGHGDLRKAAPEMLGRADHVRVERGSTLVGVGEQMPEVADRIRLLQMLHDRSKYEFDRQQLQERMARLGRGIAILEIGAPTEVELKERKQRAVDALRTVRAAMEEGVVPGGGTAYLRCLPALRAFAETQAPDLKTGIRIIIDALQAPAILILENAGHNSGEVIAGILREPIGFGFDVMATRYVNMVASGIVDSTLAACAALQSAASAAGALLTSEAGVSEIQQALPRL